jgi:hypothetical protein
MMIGKAIRKTMRPQVCRPILLFCIILCLLVVLGPLRPSFGGTNTVLLGFRQGEDSDGIPEGWELLTYLGTGENELSLITEGKRAVLHVKSLGSASALLKRPEVDIRKFPMLVWRWKIDRVVGMAIESQKDRNDSTARVRVIFGKGGEKPRPVSPQIDEFLKSLGIKRTAVEPAGFKIDYIWGNRLSRGDILDYPGSRNHKVVVVESGNTKANQWIWEKRNLIEDYELLFEAAPPGLSGIVILTDTDQTNEGVEAWYSSVVLMSE